VHQRREGRARVPLGHPGQDQQLCLVHRDERSGDLHSVSHGRTSTIFRPLSRLRSRSTARSSPYCSGIRSDPGRHRVIQLRAQRVERRRPVRLRDPRPPAAGQRHLAPVVDAVIASLERRRRPKRGRRRAVPERAAVARSTIGCGESDAGLGSRQNRGLNLRSDRPRMRSEAVPWLVQCAARACA
jgi:hypothetical protein